MTGIKIEIESRNAKEIPSLGRDGVYFVYSGTKADGGEFVGSADDLDTAVSMIKEELGGEYGDGFSNL